MIVTLAKAYPFFKCQYTKALFFLLLSVTSQRNRDLNSTKLSRYKPRALTCKLYTMTTLSPSVLRFKSPTASSLWIFSCYSAFLYSQLYIVHSLGASVPCKVYTWDSCWILAPSFSYNSRPGKVWTPHAWNIHWRASCTCYTRTWKLLAFLDHITLMDF